MDEFEFDDIFSVEVTPLREDQEMDLAFIRQVIHRCNTELMYKFLDNKAVVEKFVNGDPHDFYEILSSTIIEFTSWFGLNNETCDDMVLRLIKAAKEVHFGLFDGKTILMWAVKQQMGYKIIDELLKAGSDINAACNDHKMTPLMYALDAHYDLDIINELINRGADINCRNRHGWDILFYSMRNHYYSHPSFIETLLNAGLNVHNLDDEGSNILMVINCYCVGSKKCLAKESIDLLFKYGIDDIDLKHSDNDGNTVLHKTYCNNVLDLAIKSGASFEAKNKNGLTPLLKESMTYHREKIIYLLKSGADIHSTDSELNTAVHLCVLDNGDIWPHTLDLLIYLGVNLYAHNIYNQTPLDIIMGKNKCDKELAYFITRHIILFDDDGLDTRKKALELLYNYGYFSTCIAACKKELTLMRETLIADGLTFYEFCILKRYYKSKCLNIPWKGYKYCHSKVDHIFPIYKNIINIRIRDNRLKKRMLDFRKQFEKITFNVVNSTEIDFHVLNYDCLYHISRYLNYEEMFNVFSAAIAS